MKIDHGIRARDRLEAAKREFSQWREQREVGTRPRIPEHLWDLAYSLRNECSDIRICRCLSLNPVSFAQEVAARDRVRFPDSPTANPSHGFMELPGALFSTVKAELGATLPSGVSVEVEMTRTDGAQMKIRIHGSENQLAREALRYFWISALPRGHEC